MYGCGQMIVGVKAWRTAAPEGFAKLHHALVLWDSFIIPISGIIVGGLYLCSSKDINSLVFRSTSMAFVSGISKQIASMMSWSLSAHGGRAYQPSKICLKDDINSLNYTYYSLIA